MTTANETLSRTPETTVERSLAEDLFRVLQGAAYPLRREQLIQIARENEAPARLLTQISALPDARFDCKDDVRRALFIR